MRFPPRGKGTLRGIRKIQVGKNKEGMNEWSCGSIRCVYVIVRKEMRIDGNKALRFHPRETYSHYSRSKACFHKTK